MEQTVMANISELMTHIDSITKKKNRVVLLKYCYRLKMVLTLPDKAYAEERRQAIMTEAYTWLLTNKKW